MNADHGTLRAYRHGCHCTPCRAANAAHVQGWRVRRKAGRPVLGSRVDARDAWRRLRRLKGEFLTWTELAHRLGYVDRHLQIDRRTMTRRNWLKITRLHRAAVNEDVDAHRHIASQ